MNSDESIVLLPRLRSANESMHVLFIADPLESFKVYKDTTFAMMRELQAVGGADSVRNA